MDTSTSIPSYQLEHLSNDDLLASTRRLLGASNVVLAGLLAHLAETEARGVHRLRACSSLYTYCVYELRMSEDAALRRAHAAKIARKFPVVLEHVARGELHLTGLLMLGPHLTETNVLEVLARAKHRTKKEIGKLVRELDPLPVVPDRVEPLGPALRSVPRGNGSWSQFAAAMCGPVRELPVGERPADWMGDETQSDEASTKEWDSRASEGLAQRYEIHFEATEEYYELLQQARDLLSHAVPSRSLAEVHLRAMRLLVADLKKRKYAVTDRPRAKAAEPETRSADPAAPTSQPAEPEAREPALRPRLGGRYVPAEVRRGIWERDGGQCTYVDARGKRCPETCFLELHHEQPHALGGPMTVENMTLRCKGHNALAAEEDFGRDFMERKWAGEPAPARVATEGQSDAAGPVPG